MLMNSSQNKSVGRSWQPKLKGRTGHRIVRLNDSVFVVGGRESEGGWAHQVQRINTKNSRVDSLVLDSSISLEGPSMFALQETIYLWGGLSLSSAVKVSSQYSNQLFQFDGCKFMALRQGGEVPQPRAYHLSTTFAGKYFILYAGNNQDTFFKDWYLFNIKTLTWKRLFPSIQLGFCSGGDMVWLQGRGILLLNSVYDQPRSTYHSNQFFQFYVSNFSLGILAIQPLSIDLTQPAKGLLFTNLSSLGNNSFLVFGGHRGNDLKDAHDVCLSVDLEAGSIQKVGVPKQGMSGFQSLCYKRKLFWVGGDSSSEGYCGWAVNDMHEESRQFKRHVCEMCRLYYDEEWEQSTRQIYRTTTIKEEYDYNYQLKVENQVLQKMAFYIREDFYAFTLIISCLRLVGTRLIEAHFQRVDSLINQIVPLHPPEHHQYLKLSCTIKSQLVLPLANHFQMEEILQDLQRSSKGTDWAETILRLKLGVYRLGGSCLTVFRVNPDLIMVVYYSSSQVQCPTSQFSSFPTYSYSFKISSKQCSSSVHRSIIYQNLKTIFKTQQEYQDCSGANFLIYSFCSNLIDPQLLLLQQNGDPQTGQSSLVGSLKEQTKRSVPLIQLAFLPQQSMPQIFIDHSALTHVNLEEILEGDHSNKVLYQMQPVDSQRINNKALFSKVKLYRYPTQYWFKRILLYHKGRLISHFKLPQSRVCGIVILRDQTQLDLGGTNLCRPEDRIEVEKLFLDLKALKRIFPF